jgi:lipopolysaccharide biosynthesis glycosyltransferase
VIFLDADLLLRCDIRELWAADTSGHLVSAIPEYNDRLFDDTALSRPLRFAVRLCLHDQMRFQIGLDHTTFNTGVLILELDLIRRSEPDLSQRLLRQARDLMAAYDGEPVFFSDQDMISTCLRDRINALPAEWNFHDFLPRLLLRHGDYRRAMKAAKIMHYNGPPRPWEVFGKWRPFTRTWYRYLDQTPWAGWRPSIRHARLPRSKGRTLQTVVGGLILVCGRFRNHFFTEQDACLDSASQRSPGKSGLAQGARP